MCLSKKKLRFRGVCTCPRFASSGCFTGADVQVFKSWHGVGSYQLDAPEFDCWVSKKKKLESVDGTL